MDPEAEKIVEDFLRDLQMRLTSPDSYWASLPDFDDRWEWLELTAEAQAAWLCGPDPWFGAYRKEPAAPYRVVRMTSNAGHQRYEVDPERPDGLQVRVTDCKGKVKEQMWDSPSVEHISSYCGPPEEQHWVDLGGAAS